MIAAIGQAESALCGRCWATRPPSSRRPSSTLTTLPAISASAVMTSADRITGLGELDSRSERITASGTATLTHARTGTGAAANSRIAVTTPPLPQVAPVLDRARVVRGSARAADRTHSRSWRLHRVSPRPRMRLLPGTGGDGTATARSTEGAPPSVRGGCVGARDSFTRPWDGDPDRVGGRQQPLDGFGPGVQGQVEGGPVDRQEQITP